MLDQIGSPENENPYRGTDRFFSKNSRDAISLAPAFGYRSRSATMASLMLSRLWPCFLALNNPIRSLKVRNELILT